MAEKKDDKKSLIERVGDAVEDVRSSAEQAAKSHKLEKGVRDEELDEKQAAKSVYGRAAQAQQERADKKAEQQEIRKVEEGARGLDVGEEEARQSSYGQAGAALQAQADAVEQAAPPPAAPAPRTYKVAAGDTLGHIAQRFYGNAAQWKRIYEANRDQISNPDVIHPGQEFIIPE